MSEYLVLRHGGRSIDRDRILYATCLRSVAVERFEEARDKMRQGSVKLTEDGKVLDSAFAYRNRTRW